MINATIHETCKVTGKGMLTERETDEISQEMWKKMSACDNIGIWPI